MNNTKLYEFHPVLERLTELEPGEKIECLDLSVGCLYVGTSKGFLLQYSVVESADQHGSRRLSASFLTRTPVAANTRVTFLCPAPIINRMLVLCDDTLHILNMSDLTLLNMAGSNKLKGLSAVCVNTNPISDNPFSVEVCVSKKKGTGSQLALLSLTEDKMAVLKTKDCPEPVVTMSMDGVSVCAALSSQYVVFNMESMAMTPLFPLDSTGSVANIVSIEREEFLVQGPGNLGMFVTSAGVAGRPPIQWSNAVTRVTHCPPGHLLCLNSEMISVYDISDQAMKQGLSCSGGRCLGFYDGHILVATGNSVSSLVPVPWHQQASSLLESGKLEEAVSLAKDNEEGDLVRQKAGFIHLKEGQFDKAQELLLRGKVDVREVLSLFPGMLPSNSKFVRSNPPLHDIPDISSIKDSSQADKFLMSYLQFLVAMSGSSLGHVTIVHSALAKILTRCDPDNVVSFIRDEKTVLDMDDLTEFFESNNHHHLLAILQWKLNNSEAAISIWSKLVSGDLEDEMFPGLEFYCRHLSQCSEETIFSHCDAALDKNQVIAAKIFMKPQLRMDSDSTFVDRALNVLTKYNDARTEFLKYLVLDRDCQVEKYHTQLALAFINKLRVSNSELRKKNSKPLSKLILTSKHLNANFLLQHLEDTDMDYEKAILYGKLGQHDKALGILVNNLQDFQKAETYCDDISQNQPEQKSRLLFSLLNIYLHPALVSDQDKFTSVAVDLINSRAKDMNGSQVLSSLPEHWNISIILPALKTFSRKTIHDHRMSSVRKNLQKSENIQLREKQLVAMREPVFVMTNNFCAVCRKQFSRDTNIARYPNGVLVHESCVTNDHICPVTGHVFKIE